MADEITRLEAQYVNKSNLESLLQSLFGSTYEVNEGRGIIEVTAARQLTRDEIKSVTNNA
ncbi:hypothetical protein FVEG_17287 [Fusarium verticillioides 7600]|uniref:Uncharacterized protein n=1 Tax=Gibberella moniliformis (strain M3125 / FGSC 7600) TaxID=334819 RepID=W7NCM4_GIBM7|nr:hypothetical protein FVEG_17287 [Fusarium verticillioides 7600]EWG54257.1 hypothetical protein FVEG_17287 [Fusarium verticillioides 7600]